MAVLAGWWMTTNVRRCKAMCEPKSTEEFADHLGRTADLVISADATTFTDERVMANATKLAKALEGSMIDGRVVTGEFETVREPGQ
jgi:hypothetical protein